MDEFDPSAFLRFAPARFVCSGCFADPALKKLIAENAAEESCGFCDVLGPSEPVADLGVVVRRIEKGLRLEHDDALALLPFCGADGGFFGETHDTFELLRDVHELELPRDCDGRLIRAITSALPDLAWCGRNPGQLPKSAHLTRSWISLCEIVKYGRRYFVFDFRYPKESPFDVDALASPAEVLRTISVLGEELGLIWTMPAAAILFRGRPMEIGQGPFSVASEIGPPPPRNAQSNRMSAAGVTLMYASPELSTVLVETRTESGILAVGEFETARPLRLLDLTSIPPIPSLFDDRVAHLRESIRFLHVFAKEVSKPAESNFDAHIDYVPTQIVTEYLRFNCRPNGQPLDGILYESSLVSAGKCVALFASPENVADAGQPGTKATMVILRGVRVYRRSDAPGHWAVDS